MGYARVFWIREEPVRQYVVAHGREARLADEVGRQVFALCGRSSARWPGQGVAGLPLFDIPSVFFPFLDFHSTDFCTILWTGNRLIALPDASPAMFEALCQLQKTVGTAHVVLPASKDEYRRAIGGQSPLHNQLEQSADASVYWIYEDFTRDFVDRPERDRPVRELGIATLDLMLSNWSRSLPVHNSGNPISRSCSFRQPEFAILVWSGNCLRVISELDDDEIERMREYLAKE